MTENIPDKRSEIILYPTEDGRHRIEVRLDHDTAWLTQARMADLFETSIPNINIHIRNILADSELREASVVKDYLITAADGKTYRTKHYNLNMILAVGYRVRSPRGVQFRQWLWCRHLACLHNVGRTFLSAMEAELGGIEGRRGTSNEDVPPGTGNLQGLLTSSN